MAAHRHIVAVIEADPKQRRALMSLLSSLDADVHDYESAESYLHDQHELDGADLACVISDVSLPGMSGLELLRLMKRNCAPPPFILLGEEADVHAAVAAMREGAADFIEKPRLDVAILRRVAYLLDQPPSLRH